MYLYDELLAEGDALNAVVQENGKNLSGGQIKRLSIARALLRTPKIYILDETLANIDEDTAKEILENLEAHANKIGAGIVHISHDQFILARCDTTVALDHIDQNRYEPQAQII